MKRKSGIYVQATCFISVVYKSMINLLGKSLLVGHYEASAVIKGLLHRACIQLGGATFIFGHSEFSN